MLGTPTRSLSVWQNSRVDLDQSGCNYCPFDAQYISKHIHGIVLQ